MNDSFVLFGREIPIYGLCFFVGIVLAAVTALLICPKRGLPRWEIIYSGIYTMIGAMIGSKLFFILLSWKTIIELRLPSEAVIKGGFVFYGGLIGGFLGLWIYIKQYKMKLFDFVDIYAVCLPLGHAVGRVGCFFAGCCYGIPYLFGHVYTHTKGTTPLGIPLLPIQLIESACLCILFIALLIVYLKKPKENRRCITLYTVGYSVIRFTLEFFRGDIERGLLLGLSTSQWISLIIFGTVLILLANNHNKRSES